MPKLHPYRCNVVSPRYNPGRTQNIIHLPHENGHEYYEGFIEDGFAHGRGKYTFADGTIYEGNFKKGQRSGRGILTLSDGTSYEGDWEKDSLKEKSVVINFPAGHQYHGECKNGEREGKGICYFANGARYEGQWKHNKANGKGVYHTTKGIKFQSGWKDGKAHGAGTTTFTDGTKRKEVWTNGELIPPAYRKKSQPYHVITLIGEDAPNVARNIKSSFVTSVTVTNIDEVMKPDLPQTIRQYSCLSKSGALQVVFDISTHGQDDQINDKIFLEKLEFVCRAISENNRRAHKGCEVIRRVKLNLSACHGDKIIAQGDLQETIKLFVDAGIDVVTSSINGRDSSGHISNGKNSANYSSNQTEIIERFYSKRMDIEEKVLRKYTEREDWNHKDGLCFVRKKTFTNLDDFLHDRYVEKADTSKTFRPSTASRFLNKVSPTKAIYLPPNNGAQL